MKTQGTSSGNMRTPPAKITWWQAKNLRSASRGDIWFVVTILLLAFASIWSGNMMALYLSPSGAATVSDILDDLQMPGRLPNAPLVSENGTIAKLWDLADSPRTVVSFYAPWCSPCQRELPEVVEYTKEKKNLLVIISSEEDPIETRRQLDNLGLRETEFLVDVSGEIMSQGKVKSLPTTFLIGKKGRVRERVVGYSEFRLRRLIEMGDVGEL